MMRKDFKEETWDVVVVNKHPYLYCDMRIKKDSIPDGLIMYEVADGDCNGRFCRIASNIMVNFLCTIVGKEPLPMDMGVYYCTCDTEFDERREKYEEELDKMLEKGKISEDIYYRKLEEYDENNFPEDKDGWFIEHNINPEEYLDKYESYLKSILEAEQ